MNNGQKGKSFERWDRDGVAQHRNLMHEIAMKKQITMYQREEKLLAKELREISKVKETLLQIRAPLRRRVQAAVLEENLESLGNEGRNSRKTSVTMRKISVAANTSAQQKCTKNFGSAHGEGTSGFNQNTLTASVSRWICSLIVRTKYSPTKNQCFRKRKAWTGSRQQAGHATETFSPCVCSQQNTDLRKK